MSKLKATRPKKKDSSLVFTGERMIPEHNKNQRIFVEHIARYLFAKQFVHNKIVLDIASGSGYGTKLLAKSGAKKVIGIDISKEAIAYAERNYATSNAKFLVGNAEKIPLTNHSIDVIISFETIEHVSDYRAFLSEVKRVLKPDGIFLVSTPNKTTYPTGNPYHTKEFYVDEFKTCLNTYFQKVLIEKQKDLTLTSIFSSIKDITNNGFTINHNLKNSDPSYVLAICQNSNKKYDYQGINFVSDSSKNLWSQKIRDFCDLIKTRDKQILEYQQCQKQLEGDIQHQKNLQEIDRLNTLKSKWNLDEFPPYDIVIPIYNGYDFIKECIESLLKKTNYPNYQVVIIDDASICEKTRKYLEKISETPRVVFLKNEKNLGFVKTVNRGMQYSKNDIVLLNSDTVLTPNWLLKMHQARTTNPLIASVTPLTNNGTICSVPTWCQDNRLPKKLSLDQYAQLIEDIHLKQYPPLPTAVGFCMLITRQSLDIVGYFDEKSFGSGYGEENDWCMQTIKHGYIHILDDQTFIQHKGNMTFGKSQKIKKQQAKNTKVLYKRYPEYQVSIANFIQQNPMLDIIENIQLNLEFNNGKKNLCYVLHNDIDDAIGGTELHVFDLVTHFRKDYNIFVLFKYKNHLKIRQFTDKIRNYIFELPPSESTPFSDPTIEKLFQQFLNYFTIDIVHFHHLMNLPLSLIEIANKSPAKVVFSLHDYFFHCPCPQLLMPDLKFCNFSKSAKKCSFCLLQNNFIRKPFKSFTFLKNRREFLSRSLKNTDRIITPSKFVSQKICKILHIPETKIMCIYHGICHKKNQKRKVKQHPKLNVAMLGVFSKIKGANLFSQLVLTLKKHKNIQFKVIGKNGEPLIFDTIKKQVIHREYNRKNLGKILEEEQIDLVLCPSILAETFCYTLSESLAHGIPVITTEIGAQTERIEELNGGWSFPITSFVKETTKLLLALEKNREKLQDQVNQIRPIKSNDEMFGKYAQIYTEVSNFKKVKSSKSIDAKIFLNAARFITPPKNTENTWKDKVYWFLVKMKMIKPVRFIYHKVSNIFKKKTIKSQYLTY